MNSWEEDWKLQLISQYEEKWEELWEIKRRSQKLENAWMEHEMYFPHYKYYWIIVLFFSMGWY
jgi:hypothetical protein